MYVMFIVSEKKGTRIVLHLTTGQWNMNRSGIFLPANELRSRVKILQGARCKVQGEQLQGEKYARCKVQGAGARSFFSHPARTADIDLRVTRITFSVSYQVYF